ncbi:unnamed protein product, partial [Heterotrigona itama]
MTNNAFIEHRHCSDTLPILSFFFNSTFIRQIIYKLLRI